MKKTRNARKIVAVLLSLLTVISALSGLAPGAGAEVTPKYTVSLTEDISDIDNAEYATFTPAQAAPGEEVAVVLKCTMGYFADNIVITAADGTPVEFTVTKKDYEPGTLYGKLTMPAQDVKVSFEALPLSAFDFISVEQVGMGTVRCYSARFPENPAVLSCDWCFDMTPAQGYELVFFEAVTRDELEVVPLVDLGNGVYKVTDPYQFYEVIIRAYFCRPATLIEDGGPYDGYYEINTADKLYWFAQQVNSGNNTIKAVLTADIDLNPGYTFLADGTVTYDGVPVTKGFNSWFPIGYYYDRDGDGDKEDLYFRGIFDGQGHSISGLYFNNDEQSMVGLFGQTDGVVQNVSVRNSYICAGNVVGGVVGLNGYGDVKNVCNEGALNADSYVGGVVGWNAGDLFACYNVGVVNGAYSVGGIVGDNLGSVSACYNIGNVSGGLLVGGVAGINSGALSRCYDASNAPGGVAGGVNNEGFFESCYYLSDTEFDEFEEILAKSAAQFASGEVAYLLGDAFGQRVGTDALPVFRAADNAVYAGYISCAENAALTYSNDSGISKVKPPHDMADASCESPKICKNGCGYTEGDPLGHLDENKDHLCDRACGKSDAGACEDANKDHACDYGCAKVYGVCEDANKDHICDYGCAKVHGVCEDANKDHACDYGCAKVYGVCEDANKDHVCDYGCTKSYGTHADGEDKDLLCDYGCGAEFPREGLPAGAVVGIVIGSVVVAALGGFAIFWFAIKKKKWSDLVAIVKK